MANQICSDSSALPFVTLFSLSHSHLFFLISFVLPPLGAPDDRPSGRGSVLSRSGRRDNPITGRASHVAPTRVVRSIRHTALGSCGRVWPLEGFERDRRHLPGADLACISTERGSSTPQSQQGSTPRIGAASDTVTICLLECPSAAPPLGRLIAGSADLMTEARRGKHFFGGAIARLESSRRPALYALDPHHVPTALQTTHARARRRPRLACRRRSRDLGK